MAAYLVLRRNAQLIIQISRTIFRDIFGRLFIFDEFSVSRIYFFIDNQRIENELLHAFYLDRTESQALDRIGELIESGMVRLVFLKGLFVRCDVSQTGNEKCNS